MNKIKYFMLDPGFTEDTVLYAVKLERLDSVNGTVEEVVDMLEKNRVTNVIIDAANPHIIDKLKMRFRVKKIVRLAVARNFKRAGW